MTAAAVLTELRARGVNISARGDRLLVEPASALTPDLRARVLEHKPELIAILAETDGRVTRALGLTVLEALRFLAALLAALPLATSLVLRVWGVDRQVTIATHSACPRCDYDMVEWRAMIAFERPEPAALAVWTRCKQRVP